MPCAGLCNGSAFKYGGGMTITLTREEAQQMLDALEKVTKQMLLVRDELAERGARPVMNPHHQTLWDNSFKAYTEHAIPAAQTLRAKLSAPEPEPVAWVPVHPKNGPLWSMTTDDPNTERLPSYPLMNLYTATPQQSKSEPVAKLFGTLPVYETSVSLKDAVKQEPVAWVENLTDAQPHAVTDLKYCSVAQHERGEHLKYIPLYADPTPCQTCEALARTVMMDQTSHDTPPQREWRSLTQREQAECWYGKHCMEQSAPYEDFARAIEAKLREKNS
jgi:hypothetical protein